MMPCLLGPVVVMLRVLGLLCRGSLAPDVEVEAALYGVSLGIADGWRENGSMQIITGLLPVILPTTRDGNGYPKPDGFLLY